MKVRSKMPLYDAYIPIFDEDGTLMHEFSDDNKRKILGNGSEKHRSSAAMCMDTPERASSSRWFQSTIKFVFTAICISLIYLVANSKSFFTFH